jgi:ribonuclease BN (tRNA processing enzyme)/polynucleotide 5'-kinase involved in rRNA processing
MNTEEAALALARELASGPGAVVFLGRPGRGKSTLVRAVTEALAAAGAETSLLAADPGQPAHGPPAAFALASPSRISFLGSIDPMAVRLTAMGELVRMAAVFRAARPGASLLVDACGLVANAIGREWAVRQVEAVAATHVVVLERAAAPGEATELAELVRLLQGRKALRLLRVTAHPEAKSPSTAARRKRRGQALTAWLEGCVERTVDLDTVALVGAPERGVQPGDWEGRLVGLLDGEGVTLGIGVVAMAEGQLLRVRTNAFEGVPSVLRVGDASWEQAGRTVARRPFAEAPTAPGGSGIFTIRAKPSYEIEPFALAGDERSKRGPGFQVHLPNGIFGDPLVHVRPLRERDAILLDLGRASSMPTKLLHRVGLVLLSHAHVDHFFGFDELLRALLGTPRTVSFVGPPGTAERIASKVGGYSWNLIEADGEAHGVTQAPRFLVRELRDGVNGAVVADFEVVPGSPLRARGERPTDGLVHEGDKFTVRAVALAHRDIRSLAYSIEERPRLAVRPEVIAARGTTAGPWIDTLKHQVQAGNLDAPIEVAPGKTERAGDLARELLVDRPGQRIVYVTDSADTPENRSRIVSLARGADLFVCEATFTRDDVWRASETAHLPAFAAAELAREAGVGKLVPFHLSPRYEEFPERIFKELLELFPRVQVPRPILDRLAGRARTDAVDAE